MGYSAPRRRPGRAHFDFGRGKAVLEVLPRAHPDDPIFFHAHARAFEHFAALVPRNQPRTRKNETHRRKPPSGFGNRVKEELTLRRLRGRGEHSALGLRDARRLSFSFTEERAVQRNGARPKGCRPERFPPGTNASPYMSNASRSWNMFSFLHNAAAISQARRD